MIIENLFSLETLSAYEIMMILFLVNAVALLVVRVVAAAMTSRVSFSGLSHHRIVYSSIYASLIADRDIYVAGIKACTQSVLVARHEIGATGINVPRGGLDRSLVLLLNELLDHARRAGQKR